jgi:hypothetical protein
MCSDSNRDDNLRMKAVRRVFPNARRQRGDCRRQCASGTVGQKLAAQVIFREELKAVRKRESRVVTCGSSK